MNNTVSATHYFVGGGIASLAAAVFLVRDAGVPGTNIVVFEQDEILGGSLDGGGGPENGYLVRGGRMFEKHFACTFDLLASIPAAGSNGRSIRDDILAFNQEVKGSARCRLVRSGEKADAGFGLRATHMVEIVRLTMVPEKLLAERTIESWFSPDFFDTNFWLMWSTTFSFQRWHSAAELARYFRRFVHLLPGFKRLEGILRTRHNQYDALISPILSWLGGKGVRFRKGIRVSDAEFERNGTQLQLSALRLVGSAQDERIPISPEDRVYLTLGSMTAGSTVGSNSEPPASSDKPGSWELWTRLASREPVFGRPERFCADISRTSWESFTGTLSDPAFFKYMEDFTGNAAGTGGLVTFAGSAWTLSIVLFHQPHFMNQPRGSFVFWGYGLRGDRNGDFIHKPMASCSGDEIIAELSGHLKIDNRASSLFDGAKVIPCRMPFITSQFMPRRPGDRPRVVPEGSRNFAVLGQFCEMPDDVVFTVEYSVRSAMEAVHALAGGRPPPPVQRTDRDPFVLIRAGWTLCTG